MFKIFSLLILTLSFFFAGCKLQDQGQENKVRALSSNDWFKNGVDRFYLAYMDAGQKIHEDHPYKYGDRYFIGLGCYGESENQHKLVDVPVSPGSTEFKKIPLSQRVMIHEFPLVKGLAKPKKGECKIILGSANEPRQLIGGRELAEGGEKVGVTFSALGAGFSCLSVVIVGSKLVGTAVAGGYATVQTGGVVAGVVIPLIVTDVVAVGTTGALCGMRTGIAHKEIKEFKTKENQKLLAISLDKASHIATDALKSSGNWKLYNDLSKSQVPKNLELASAMWNREFVKAFNMKVFDSFENGWGGETKFFNAVNSLQTEVLARGVTYSND